MAVTLDKIALETVAQLYIEGIALADMHEKMMMGRCESLISEKARNRGLSPVYPSEKPNFQGAREFAAQQESFGRTVFQWMADAEPPKPQPFTVPPPGPDAESVRVIAALVRMMGGVVILDAHDLKPLELTPIIATTKMMDPYGIKIEVVDASKVDMT